MTSLQGLLVTRWSAILLLAKVLTTEAVELQPFGPANFDTLMAPGDDAFAELVLPTQVRLPFLDVLYDRYFVGTNGYVSMGKGMETFRPEPFPINTTVMFSAFWSDIDNRPACAEGNNIFYRQDADANGLLLKSVSADIQRGLPQYRTYRATWATVMTFDRVRPYTCCHEPEVPPMDECRHPRNTFQIILTTNGVRTFGIFNYKEINWVTRPGQTLYANAGFNSGKNNYHHELPGSRTPALVDLVRKSNVGVDGQWMFEVGQEKVTDLMCNYNPSAETKISSVLPRYGSAFGGEYVEIMGVCAVDKDDPANSDVIRCRFGKIVVPGVRLAEASVRCIAPPLAGKGDTVLEVSRDRGATYPYKTTYRYDTSIYDVELVNRNTWSSRVTAESTIALKWDPLLIGDSMTSKVDVEFFGWYQTGTSVQTGLRSISFLLATGVPNGGDLALTVSKINFVRNGVAEINQALLGGAFRIVNSEDRTRFFQQGRWTQAVRAIWSQVTDMDVFSGLRSTELPTTGADTITVAGTRVTYRRNGVVGPSFGQNAILAFTPYPTGRVETIFDTTQWNTYFRARQGRLRLANRIAECLTDAFYSTFCECWSSQEKSIIPYNSDDGASFLKCPATMNQARVDRGRFAPEPIVTALATCNKNPGNDELWQRGPCDEHPEATLCVNSLIRNFNELEQQCCYSSRGNLIDAGTQPGGGRVQFSVLYNRLSELALSNPGDLWLVQRMEEQLIDRKPQEVCCPRGSVWSSQDCQLFRKTRRGGSAQGYVAPAPPGGGYGDPHIWTLDGLQYTFNGLGEYVVLRIPNEVDIQGRTAKVHMAEEGEKITATVWSGLAIKSMTRTGTTTTTTTVQVSLSTLEGLNVYLNKERLLLSEYADVIEAEGMLIHLMRNTESSAVHTVSVQLNSGIAIEIASALDEMVQFKVSLPGEMANVATSGLLGVRNGNPNDDLLPKGETTPLSVGASPERIFTDFGEKWRVTKAESAFTYQEPFETYESFNDLKFRPSFVANPPVPTELAAEAATTCAGNRHCLFDIATTKRLDVGKASRGFQTNLQNDIDVIDKKIVSCGFPSVTRSNVQLEQSSQDYSYNVGDVVQYRCHHPDPKLTVIKISGQERLTCQATGLWDAEPLRCAVSCGSPGDNGQVIAVTPVEGDLTSTVQLGCNSGYPYVSGSTSATCKSDGTYEWTGSRLVCSGHLGSMPQMILIAVALVVSAVFVNGLC